YRRSFASFLKATNGSGSRPIPETWKRSTGLDLSAVEQGWRDAVLQWKMPAHPVWVIAAVKTADPAADVRDGDRIWSIDSKDIGDVAAAESAWDHRSKDQATKLVLVRRTNQGNADDYVDAFVEVSLPSASILELQWSTDPNRAWSVRD